MSCDIGVDMHAVCVQLLQQGHKEVTCLLTKKRRLKRNRKYLVTVMQPFPIVALLEDRNRQMYWLN